MHTIHHKWQIPYYDARKPWGILSVACVRVRSPCFSKSITSPIHLWIEGRLSIKTRHLKHLMQRPQAQHKHHNALMIQPVTSGNQYPQQKTFKKKTCFFSGHFDGSIVLSHCQDTAGWCSCESLNSKRWSQLSIWCNLMWGALGKGVEPKDNKVYDIYVRISKLNRNLFTFGLSEWPCNVDCKSQWYADKIGIAKGTAQTAYTDFYLQTGLQIQIYRRPSNSSTCWRFKTCRCMLATGANVIYVQAFVNTVLLLPLLGTKAI